MTGEGGLMTGGGGFVTGGGGFMTLLRALAVRWAGAQRRSISARDFFLRPIGPSR